MMRIMMMGCLTLSLLLAGGGYMAWRWWETEGKQRAADGVKQVVDGSIDQSGLSADDKTKLRNRINRTVDDFRAGKITFQDLGNVAQKLADSPVMAALSAHGALADELKEGSGTLQDPRKRAEAQRAMERFIRAVMEQKVDLKRVDEVTAALRESTPQGDKEKEHLTAQDVEKVVSQMKKAADEAHIPDEPYQADYVGEVTRIIDKALEKKTAP